MSKENAIQFLNRFRESKKAEEIMKSKGTLKNAEAMTLALSEAAAEMGEKTRDWIMSYKGQSILLPERFVPAKEFIEYHKDTVFVA